MTQPSPSPAAAARSRGDFSTLFVLEALVQQGLLQPAQAQDVLAREPAARARVLKAKGATGKEAARYEVSPVEIVAAFQVALPDGRGVLDEDRVTEAAAKAAGCAYRKIDPAQAGHAAGHAHGVAALRAEARAAARWSAARAAAWWWRWPTPSIASCSRTCSSWPARPSLPVLSAKGDILKLIAEIYGFKRTLAQAATDFGAAPQIANFEQLVSLSGNQELEASDRPIVQAVDYLLRYAYDNRASDIHIEPKREASLVRLRIDGVLHPALHAAAGRCTPRW